MNDVTEREGNGTQLVELIQASQSPLGIDRATIDAQVATAKQYPRSLSRFRKDAEALACMDEDTAEECIYAVPRWDGGKKKMLEGPSVRFAEILLYAYENARADAEVIDIGDTHLTAQGVFFDLQRNTGVRKKVERQIIDSHGNRYGANMIGVTGNAAVSIALRNAILAGIPKPLWKGLYEKARRASLGKAGTHDKARQDALDWFGKLGYEPPRVFALLDVDGVEDIGEDELITLRGLANAIKAGDITAREAFAPAARSEAGTADLNEQIRKAAEVGAVMAEENSGDAGPAEAPKSLEDLAAETEVAAHRDES